MARPNGNPSPARRSSPGLASAASEYTAVQLAGLLGEHKVKLVPEIAVSGEGGATRLADVLVGRLLASMRPASGEAQT